MRIASILVFFCFSIARAEASEFRILVVVGYADSILTQLSLNPSNWHQTRRLLPLARTVENGIRNHLALNGLVETLPDEFETQDRNLQITLKTSTTLCPGETWEKTSETRPCSEQFTRSRDLVRFIDERASDYDELIYIGHARHGSGFGLGPFTPDFTWKPRFYSSREIGRLKKVFMASCDAERYYGSTFRRFFQFEGLKGTVDWESQMLPAVLQELTLQLSTRTGASISSN